MSKVYCKNCKYSGILGICLSKKPRKSVYSGEDELLTYPEGYKHKNKFGDCKDYKKAWRKFWI